MASGTFSKAPLSLHRQQRLLTLFQLPQSGGRTRRGAPVRRIQDTALIKVLPSLA